jgi:hypothetical protein
MGASCGRVDKRVQIAWACRGCHCRGFGREQRVLQCLGESEVRGRHIKYPLRVGPAYIGKAKAMDGHIARLDICEMRVQIPWTCRGCHCRGLGHEQWVLQWDSVWVRAKARRMEAVMAWRWDQQGPDRAGGSAA